MLCFHNWIITEKYTIPKGVSVAIADFLLHRDSTAFPDAEVFNPQRFSQENAVGRSAFSYVPFSGTLEIIKLINHIWITKTLFLNSRTKELYRTKICTSRRKDRFSKTVFKFFSPIC